MKEPITIRFPDEGDRYFRVDRGGRVWTLGWDEMLGQVAAMTLAGAPGLLKNILAAGYLFGQDDEDHRARMTMSEKRRAEADDYEARLRALGLREDHQ